MPLKKKNKKESQSFIIIQYSGIGGRSKLNNHYSLFKLDFLHVLFDNFDRKKLMKKNYIKNKGKNPQI